MTNKHNIAKMSFEEAMAELEQIVRKIDSGSGSLEDSIDAYERGILLKNYCESKLQEAKLKIDKITKKNDGTVEISDADLEKITEIN